MRFSLKMRVKGDYLPTLCPMWWCRVRIRVMMRVRAVVRATATARVAVYWKNYACQVRVEIGVGPNL